MNTDRFNVNTSLSNNWEQLQAKHAGTGHPDTTKFEWATNQHRDSCVSFVGHSDLLSYFSIAENKSVERKRVELLEKMIQPIANQKSSDSSSN
jgi:splicing factor 3B subunit 5